MMENNEIVTEKSVISKFNISRANKNSSFAVLQFSILITVLIIDNIFSMAIYLIYFDAIFITIFTNSHSRSI